MNSTVTTHPRRLRVAVWVFTVVVALAGVFAPAVSAAAGVGPEARVRALDHPTQAGVGRVDLGSSTGAGVSSGYLRRLVSATGVATNTFPSTADELTGRLGVDPVRSMTKDGTPRFRWEPNERTRITMESHPEGLRPGDVGFNPRHHGEHFHVQTRPTAMTGWNNPAVTKVLPPGYTPGSGTGFLPGEAFPG